MIQFILGIIIGLLLSLIIFVVLAYFNGLTQRVVERMVKTIESKGPKETGAVFFPEDDAEIARKEYIEKNRAQGKPTRFEELQ